MTTQESKALQFDLLDIIRRYSKRGADRGDIAKCVLNLAAILSLDAKIQLEQSVEMYRLLYEMAVNDVGSSASN